MEDEKVIALIEVKISPQEGDGYDRIARRIYDFEEVDSLYLMTGTYDLLVTMNVTSMKEAAQFVYERLATLNGVTSTTTHFIMKKYKENGIVLVEEETQEERLIFV
jgi:DNA-binding Lrp family transcriptional regulator